MYTAEICGPDRYKPSFLKSFQRRERGGQFFVGSGHVISMLAFYAAEFLAYCVVSVIDYDVEEILAFSAEKIETQDAR